MVEEILEFRKFPDNMRVSLVVTRFKGRATAWWQQLKESRRQANKSRIDSWARLTKHMRRNFLPYNYERTLYNKLQNLRQGNHSVEEYTTDFFHMAARMTTAETQEQLISRFIGVLRSQLQNALQQFNPSTVSEAHQRALAMEVQLRSNWTSSSTRTRPQLNTTTETTLGQSSNATTSKPDANQKDIPNDSIASSRLARSNALRCFTCGERGHIQTACPKQNRRGLLTQEAACDGEPRFDEYNSDQDNDNDEIEGDTGPQHQILVLRRSCLAPRSSLESWLRTSLFRSTCTINDKICKLIIDSGSCANVIAEEAILKLGINTTSHPCPY